MLYISTEKIIIIIPQTWIGTSRESDLYFHNIFNIKSQLKEMSTENKSLTIIIQLRWTRKKCKIIPKN